MRNQQIKKAISTFIITLYATYYTFTSTSWHFIDNLNLIIHEAGHTIFSFMPKFIYIAAGSGFQILFPAIFSLYFLYKEDRYSASMVLFWVGTNIINISVYARDAVDMHLPLLGGNDSIHDWNYLLSSLNLLDHTHSIADFIFALGILTFIFATFLSFTYSFQK